MTFSGFGLPIGGSVAGDDITPVLDRIVERVRSVTDIGLVYGYDIFARSDLAPKVVSEVAAARRLRVWWVSGPTMTGELAEQQPAGYQRREWTYRIHGVDGLQGDNGDQTSRIRLLAQSVANVLDADRRLNRTCLRTWPASMPEEPTLTALDPLSVVVAKVTLTKRVLTISKP